jgi:hypothetical protein
MNEYWIIWMSNYVYSSANFNKREKDAYRFIGFRSNVPLRSVPGNPVFPDSNRLSDPCHIDLSKLKQIIVQILVRLSLLNLIPRYLHRASMSAFVAADSIECFNREHRDWTEFGFWMSNRGIWPRRQLNTRGSGRMLKRAYAEPSRGRQSRTMHAIWHTRRRVRTRNVHRCEPRTYHSTRLSKRRISGDAAYSIRSIRLRIVERKVRYGILIISQRQRHLFPYLPQNPHSVSSPPLPHHHSSSPRHHWPFMQET